jgi:RNA polymerase sigma-70 factor (ECF subfamily)
MAFLRHNNCIMLDEKKLLEGAHRFDLNALEEIYDQYSPGIYRYAVRLLGNIDVAEDCVAETFSRFLSALQQKKGPGQYLKAYLYRIAHNWISDYYRRGDFMQSLDQLEEKQGQINKETVMMDDALEQVKVRGALANLTPDQRQVIVLKYLEGWDNQHVANALEKPVGAIKSLQHRALQSLRRYLDEGQ